MIKLELGYMRKGLPVVSKLNLPNNSSIKTLRKNSVLRSVYSYAIAANNKTVFLNLPGKHTQVVNVNQHFDKYIDDLCMLTIGLDLDIIELGPNDENRKMFYGEFNKAISKEAAKMKEETGFDDNLVSEEDTTNDGVKQSGNARVTYADKADRRTSTASPANSKEGLVTVKVKRRAVKPVEVVDEQGGVTVAGFYFPGDK